MPNAHFFEFYDIGGIFTAPLYVDTSLKGKERCFCVKINLFQWLQVSSFRGPDLQVPLRDYCCLFALRFSDTHFTHAPV